MPDLASNIAGILLVAVEADQEHRRRDRPDEESYLQAMRARADLEDALRPLCALVEQGPALPSTRLRLLALAEKWLEDGRKHGAHGDGTYAPQATSALAMCAWDLQRALGLDPHAPKPAIVEPEAAP